MNITAGKKSSQLIDDDVRAKTVAVPSSHVVLWLGKDYQAQKCATQNIQENCSDNLCYFTDISGFIRSMSHLIHVDVALKKNCLFEIDLGFIR